MGGPAGGGRPGVSATDAPLTLGTAGHIDHGKTSHVLDVALALHEPAAPLARRVQVHHDTRDVAGRLVVLAGRYWQLRLEQPLLVADGDRLVIRRISPPDTLGGAIVLDAGARCASVSAPSSARRERSRLVVCATISTPRASSPTRCSSTSMPIA
jgi:selenocysteine-specific translation elongation factor